MILTVLARYIFLLLAFGLGVAVLVPGTANEAGTPSSNRGVCLAAGDPDVFPGKVGLVGDTCNGGGGTSSPKKAISLLDFCFW